MRHATILDAFNEASRFTQQGLGVLTKEKEYELDTELYTQSINLAALQNKLILDYTRIDQQGQMFRQNADEYQKHVDAELDNFFRNATDAGRKYSLGRNEPSRYYTEKLRQLEAQGRLAMGQRYKEAAVKNEQENAAVAYAGLSTALQNNGAGIVDQMNAYDDQVRVNRKDAVTEFQDRSGLYTQGYKDAVAPGDIGNLTFDELKTQINNREAQFFKDTEIVLQGKSLGEYIPGMKGIKDTALQATQQAVWSRDFKKGRLENEQFENAAKMANKEDPRQVAAILDWQKRITQEKTRLLKDGNYNPGDETGPQIARWGELPAGWDTGGKKPAKPSYNDAVNEAVQKFLDGFVPQESGVTATGGLVGPGVSLTAVYQELEKMNKETGWGVDDNRLRHLFDSALLRRVQDKTETSEGKRVISQLITLTNKEKEDLVKRTGLSEDRLESELIDGVLNLYAEHSKAVPSPQRDKALTDSLAALRNAYVGKSLGPIFDDAKTSGSTFKLNFWNDLKDLSEGLRIFSENPALATPGRSGGAFVPSQVNDNLQAYHSYVKDTIAKEIPGLKNVQSEGVDVIGTDKDGKRYRITGNSDKKIVLQRETETGWKTIAQRRSAKEKETGWIEIDANGRAVIIPNQTHSAIIPEKYKKVVPPNEPGPKPFGGL